MQNLVFIVASIIILICEKCNHSYCLDIENDFAEFDDSEDRLVTEKNAKTKKDHSENEGTNAGFKKDDDDDDDDDELENDVTNGRNIASSMKNTEDQKVDQAEDDEAFVQDEESDEVSHFSDEEEFIGYDNEKPQGSKSSYSQEPKITIANVPLHLRSNWDSYYLEMLMITGIVIYFINFIMGKGKNHKLANDWFNTHKSMLESCFNLVGDDGKLEIENPGLQKESENVYTLWCSGRTMMEGMLIEFRLLKRQDMIGVISQLIRPSSDQLVIKVYLDEMDTFVFSLGTKKSATRLAKDMTDISTYCPDKRGAEKYGLGPQYLLYSELNEVTVSILKDQKVMSVLLKYPDLLEYLHFSDQYSGPKQLEDAKPSKLPEVKKMLVFCFNFTNKGKIPSTASLAMTSVLQLVLYLSDKLARLKLTKEAKQKAEKNRAKVEEAFLKATHSVRAEMAQNIREEKKRKEREKMLSLDDPDKQKKWEEKEQRKQLKRRNPKMKTLKIRPM